MLQRYSAHSRLDIRGRCGAPGLRTIINIIQQFCMNYKSYKVK